MSEPRVAYCKSNRCNILEACIKSLEEQIHHDIEYYGMDMSEELAEELKGLEKACRSVGKVISKG